MKDMTIKFIQASASDKINPASVSLIFGDLEGEDIRGDKALEVLGITLNLKTFKQSYEETPPVNYVYKNVRSLATSTLGKVISAPIIKSIAEKLGISISTGEEKVNGSSEIAETLDRTKDGKAL